MGFSELLGTIGGLGNFQIIQTTLMFIPGMLYISHNLLQNFIAVVPAHHCQIPNRTTESPFLGDGQDWDLLKVSIPMDKGGKTEMCLRFPEPQWELLNPNATEQARPDTEDCLDGWVYDKSVFSSSIFTEWNLVCGQKSLKSLAQTIYFGGQQAGCVVFGIMSDRLGRRTVMLWSSLLAMIAGTCAAFVPTFAGYVIFRFFVGAAVGGIYLSRHCLTLEWTPTEKMILVHTCNVYAFTLGQILLSGWAYMIREWRWLQFSTSIVFGISLLFSLFLPESARWLITHSKLHVAVKTLQKVAWINGQKEQGRKLTSEELMSHIEEDLTTVKPRSSLRDLFQTPGICKMTLCIMVGWFACGFSFYGISLDLQKFGFSIYLVQVLFAFIDIPARLLLVITISYLGNRFTIILYAIISGSLIIISIFVPEDMAALRLSLSVLGKGSMGCMHSCFHLYTLELYPTEIRQMGMSIGAFVSRFGSVLAPLVFIIGSYVPVLQPLLFGAVPILSAIATCFLIETQGLPLLETIQEAEQRLKRARSLRRNASQDVQERPVLLISEMPQTENPV